MGKFTNHARFLNGKVAEAEAEEAKARLQASSWRGAYLSFLKVFEDELEAEESEAADADE